MLIGTCRYYRMLRVLLAIVYKLTILCVLKMKSIGLVLLLVDLRCGAWRWGYGPPGDKREFVPRPKSIGPALDGQDELARQNFGVNCTRNFVPGDPRSGVRWKLFEIPGSVCWRLAT